MHQCLRQCYCIDLDVDVYFTKDNFRASESELHMLVGVGKNRKVATPLTLKLTPSSIPAAFTAQASCPDKCSCECSFSSSMLSKETLLGWSCKPKLCYCFEGGGVVLEQ